MLPIPIANMNYVVTVAFLGLKIVHLLLPRPLNSADFLISMVDLARNHNVSRNKFLGAWRYDNIQFAFRSRFRVSTWVYLDVITTCADGAFFYIGNLDFWERVAFLVESSILKISVSIKWTGRRRNLRKSSVFLMLNAPSSRSLPILRITVGK
jgi:hypothetical protein